MISSRGVDRAQASTAETVDGIARFLNKRLPAPSPAIERGFKVQSVTSVGQATIPATFRTRLNLATGLIGSRDSVRIDDLGSMILVRPCPTKAAGARPVFRSGQFTLPAEIRRRWNLANPSETGDTPPSPAIEVADVGSCLVIVPSGGSVLLIEEWLPPETGSCLDRNPDPDRRRVLVGPAAMLTLLRAGEASDLRLPWTEALITPSDYLVMQDKFAAKRAESDLIESYLRVLGSRENNLRSLASCLCALETVERLPAFGDRDRDLSLAAPSRQAAASYGEFKSYYGLTPSETERAIACLSLDADHLGASSDLSDALAEAIGQDRVFKLDDWT